jgi:uncharacterized protein (DUF885 family)
VFSFVVLIGAIPARAQEPRPVPDLREIVAKPQSEVADVVRRYEADRGSLQRTYTVPTSPTRHERMRRFHNDWLEALEKLKDHKFAPPGQEDYTKLVESVKKDLKALDDQAKRDAEIASLVPFAPTIVVLEESRRRMERVDPQGSAGKLNEMKKQIEKTRKELQGAEHKPAKAQITAASETANSLRNTLKNWLNFYNGYDPLFTWWLAEPYKEADAALTDYVSFLKDKLKPGDAKPPLAASRSPDAPSATPKAAPTDVPDLLELIKSPPSEMKPVIQRYGQDRSGVGRMANMPGAQTPPRSPERTAQLRKHYNDWLDALAKLDFDSCSQDGKVDYLLLRNVIQRELRRLDVQAKQRDEQLKLLPFDTGLNDLIEGAKKLDSDKAVEALKKAREQVDAALKALAEKKSPSSPEIAAGAARLIPALKAGLVEWFDKGAKGDEKWAAAVKDLQRGLRDALDKYANALRDVTAAKKDDSGIEGRPIGREALIAELTSEMIPYSPEELIAIANKEYAWCEVEMKKASRAMGFGDDWKKAVEKVKTLHVEPGRQVELIRDLSREAVAYVREHDLVTVPALADETWRQEMMSPQRQLYSPFFTGGEVISIAFPTNTMSHDAKLQSLRGNNIHFARATVHHELIPGHHLQGFMSSRYKSYRGPFNTSFWTEGGALYWEFVLYDMGFPKTPEDKVGFLTWRMHRCARIVFSLSYHLGTMTPSQCIDYLVDKVGFERDNAAAEVRRSFSGGYGPLYQLSYMMGGLQLWSLRKELVDTGKMTQRQFHDAILKENRIPIAMVRASLTKQKLTRDHVCDWKFYGPNPLAGAKGSETP